MVMEDMRVEELDSDFEAVVEILYDPGRFLIPPKRKKKGTWNYPKWQIIFLYMKFRDRNFWHLPVKQWPEKAMLALLPSQS